MITIKGGKDGLRMLIDEEGDWAEVLTALHAKLDQAGSFFVGARLVVEVGERLVNEQHLSHMLEMMKQQGLQPELLQATTRESRDAARAVGLATRPTPQVAVASGTPGSDSESTLLFRTVRSGQVVRHHGHITLIGDVNAGAQMIAGGSIVVWGHIRGLVHAGALGDVYAVVCALNLCPTQLRIANLIARTPEDEETPVQIPEIAHIEGEYIVVEPWDEYKRGG